jgi:hypothetical protein
MPGGWFQRLRRRRPRPVAGTGVRASFRCRAGGPPQKPPDQFADCRQRCTDVYPCSGDRGSGVRLSRAPLPRPTQAGRDRAVDNPVARWRLRWGFRYEDVVVGGCATSLGFPGAVVRAGLALDCLWGYDHPAFGRAGTTITGQAAARPPLLRRAAVRAFGRGPMPAGTSSDGVHRSNAYTEANSRPRGQHKAALHWCALPAAPRLRRLRPGRNSRSRSGDPVPLCVAVLTLVSSRLNQRAELGATTLRAMVSSDRMSPSSCRRRSVYLGGASSACPQSGQSAAAELGWRGSAMVLRSRSASGTVRV